MNEAEARAYLSAKLPGLRQPCKRCRGSGMRNQQKHLTCADCGGRPMTAGRGWVPKEIHLEDLLAAMEEAGWQWFISEEREWEFWREGGRLRGRHRNPIIAAALALLEEEP